MVERLVGRTLHYAWLIVLVTFVTLITTAGFRATPGVLIVPLQQEFGWSRGTISIAISLGLLLFGLTAAFSAALMERFGMRRVMVIALVTIATGASLTTIMTAPWQLDLLWGVVVGGATGAISVPLGQPSRTAGSRRAHHMTAVTGASLLALMGVFDIVGTTTSGWLTDRLDPRHLLAWYYALRGLVFGWIYAAHQFGAAAAAWAAGASRGWFGTYSYAFVSAGVLCLLAAGLSLRIGRREGILTMAPEPLPA
jgi:cyanate permease